MENSFAFITCSGGGGAVGPVFSSAKLPASALIQAVLNRLPAVRATRITGVRSSFAQINGWVISVPLNGRSPAELPEQKILRRIIRAGCRAQKLGVRIAGLGGLAGRVGGGGAAVARHLRIAVTTGASYAVASAVEGVLRASGPMGHSLDRAEVAVLGAAGPRGAACARILAREGVDRLTLVDEDRRNLDILAHSILFESGVSCRISSGVRKAARRADIVITFGEGDFPLPEAGDFKPGSVICAAAGLFDFALQASSLRQDILVIEGAASQVPGDFPPGHDPASQARLTCPCLAETMILALEGRFENYSLGNRLRVEKVQEIRRLAAKHGFKPAGLYSMGRPVSGGEIARIREAASRAIPAGRTPGWDAATP